MKKGILWALIAVLLVGAVLLGVFFGCNNTGDNEQTDPTNATVAGDAAADINDAIEYLKSIYKDDGAKTPVDYERFGIVRIAGIPFEVVWSADVGEDLVKIVVNDDGTVTIDVNEKCDKDTPYVLTATITDENGNSVSHSWNYVLPQAVDMVAIVKAAYALAPGESLPYESTLTGKITAVNTPWSDEYKNITVTIEVEGAEDMPIQCYRLKGDGAESLQIGDIITVTGTLKNYNGTIEFDAGCILDAVTIGERVEAPSDPKQIVDEAYALGANKSLPYEATLTGTIVSIGTAYDEYYGNVTVTIEVEGRESKPIVCYRMKGDGVDKIGVNDIITVRGYITNYVGSSGYSTIEFTAGCQLISWEDREAPVAPSDPKKIVDEAYALGANKSLRYEATLTGKITKVGTAYDASFDNITVTMVIEGRESKPIVCYRMKGNGVSKIDIGDTITVRGYITNYVGDAGYSTIEFNYPTLVSYKKNTTKAPTDQVQIVKDAYALAAGAQLPYKATLTGRITAVNTPYDADFDNITVTIAVNGAESMPIKCYRLKGDNVSKIDIGDTITVTGYIENYQHSSGSTEVEFVAGCVMTNWKQGSGVSAPTSQVQIVKEAYALAPNASLEYKATLTGTITKVKEAYSSQYKNITVIIEVAGAEDMPITCYRLKGTGADKIGVGDIITVSGYITNYQHSSGDTEVEFTSGCTLDSWKDVGGSTTDPTEPTEPEETTPSVDFEAELVTAPKAGVAYKMAMDKAGELLFFNGQTESKDITYRLAASANAADAVDVYLEAVSGKSNAYYLYFMDGNTKTYIRVFHRTDGDPGYGKGSLEFVTKAPAEYFVYDTAAKTLVYDYDGNNAYYLGTYGTYTTFSVSNTSYITGNNAGNVDVSQFPARFYTVEISEEPQPTEPIVPEPTVPEPTEPEETEPIATLVEAPEAGVAYKMAMDKAGEILYFNGSTESEEVTYRLATSTKAAEAVDVYLEAVSGKSNAYYLYFMDGNTKTYIRVFHRTDGDPGYGKGSLEFVTEAPTEYFAYDTTAKTLVYDYDVNNAYYLGTYSTYTTFSVSNTSYITGNNAGNVDVSQFPARFYTVKEDTVPDTTEPTVPDATEPSEPETTEPVVELVEAPETGVAYKMAMDKAGEVLYFNGTTETAEITYRLATSTNVAEAVDVYLEAVSGKSNAYYLYFMNGETKTYIRVFHRTDGDPGYGKGSLEFVTEAPTEYFAYDTTAKTLVYDYDGNNAYYLGTYSTYTTFSVSNTSYITGNNAGNVDVSQFPARFYTVKEDTVPDTTEPTVPDATEPSEPETTEPVVEPVEVPEAGVAYKMAMDKSGTMLYFNGATESQEVTYRLATSTKAAEAVDVYLEAVSGKSNAYYLYFMNGETKTYIRVFHRTDGDPGYGKGSLEFVTEAPTEYFVYDTTAKTLVYDYDGNNAYYMGTYSTYTTFSVSNTSYITGNNAGNVDVSQFPARLYTAELSEEPEPTEPTVPDTTEPEETEPAATLIEVPEAGVAYKMAMDKAGELLYFNGSTESEEVTYRLATSTNVAEAVDVYLEAVDGVTGGYRLYFMNGETKTYIRVFHRTDGDPGYGKGSLEFVTEAPTEYFVYDTTAKTLVYDYDGNNAYYMGTYSTYTTFSVSNTSYITGDKAGNVDVSQFPARFYAIVEE